MKMKVLQVSSHLDDIISSCGTLDRLRTPENDLWTIYFCPGTENPRNKGIVEEHHKAVELINLDTLIEHSFLMRGLENHKQEIRDLLWEIKQEFKPDLVICQSIHDFHQDHKAVADCCLTVFRDESTILGAEIIRSSSGDFKANLHVELSAKNVKKKIEVIKCYRTQLEARPYYFSVDRYVAKMRSRGVSIKAEYAEAYEFLWGRI